MFEQIRQNEQIWQNEQIRQNEQILQSDFAVFVHKQIFTLPLEQTTKKNNRRLIELRRKSQNK